MVAQHASLLEVRNYEGRTPLECAQHEGHEQALIVLIDFLSRLWMIL